MNTLKNFNLTLINGLIIVVALCFASCSTTTEKELTTEQQAEIVLNNIHSRKSVRHFTDEKVSKEQLITLAKAAMAAPTARNSQPWQIIAIDDRAVLDSLCEVLPYAKMLKQAPAAMLVCGDMTKAIEGEGRQFWIQDCSAATENLLLAAEGMGLGAVWTAVYPDNERLEGVYKVLNLPSYIIPLNVIPIGYPTGEDMHKIKWNEESFHYNGWE